jgi:hypothetical protein
MTLTPTASLSPSQRALLSRHIANLEIENRYNHYFLFEYRRLIRLVTDMRRTQQDVAQNLLVFRNNAYYKSVNSWGHIFYSGVLANPSLLQFLEQAELPSYP